MNAPPRWFGPMTIMTCILGAFIALALKTQNVVRRENLPSSSYSGLAQQYLIYKGTIEMEQKTIGQLQKDNNQLVNSEAEHGRGSKVLAEQLNQARFLGGLTPVKGPGIVVTLKDSTRRPPSGLPVALSSDLTTPFIIHDLDIQRVVNELRASGAEAFSVNDQRVVTTTAIRCVGPAIQVNGVPLTPPFKISAIGDPATLATALKLPGGIQEQLQQTDPAMISVTKEKTVTLLAYTGATEFRFCQPVKEADAGT